MPTPNRQRQEDAWTGDGVIQIPSLRPWHGYSLAAAALEILPPDSPQTDATFVSQGVFAVADGVDQIAGSGRRALSSILGRLDRVPHPSRIRGILLAASWSLRDLEAEERHEEKGVAAVTIAFWTGMRFVVGHLGDTRAYLWRGGTVRLLTRDHYRRQSPVYNGDSIDDDESVSRLGQGLPLMQPDIVSVPVQSGDKLLICSDGLWRAASEADLIGALSLSAEDGATSFLNRLKISDNENASAVIVSVDRKDPGA